MLVNRITNLLSCMGGLKDYCVVEMVYPQASPRGKRHLSDYSDITGPT